MTTNTLITQYIYTYIYVYIYVCVCVYGHPQTDCFVVSQFFSVARHVRRLKVGSKPAQLNVRLSIKPLSKQANHFSSGILSRYRAAFVCLHFPPYLIPECSVYLESFALCGRQPQIPSPECSTHMGERIYCHPQRDCFIVSQLFSIYIYIYIFKFFRHDLRKIQK